MCKFKFRKKFINYTEVLVRVRGKVEVSVRGVRDKVRDGVGLGLGKKRLGLGVGVGPGVRVRDRVRARSMGGVSAMG